MAAITLPRVADHVHLTVNEDIDCHLRVEQVRDSLLSLSPPLAMDIPTPELGTVLPMVFVSNRMRHVLPVRMLGVTDEAPWRWTLRPAGQSHPDTRRRFVRGGGGETVELWRPDGEKLTIHHGTALDLSEGGLRTRMPLAGFVTGEALEVRTWLGEELVVTVGKVLSVRRPDVPHWIDVVVQYELPEPTARQLRKYLFAWEVQERRRDHRDER